MAGLANLQGKSRPPEESGANEFWVQPAERLLQIAMPSQRRSMLDTISTRRSDSSLGPVACYHFDKYEDENKDDLISDGIWVADPVALAAAFARG